MAGASHPRCKPEPNVSLVERYTDGGDLSKGFVQGIRFDILGGKPSFRVGAQHGERADITMVPMT